MFGVSLVAVHVSSSSDYVGDSSRCPLVAKWSASLSCTSKSSSTSVICGTIGSCYCGSAGGGGCRRLLADEGRDGILGRPMHDFDNLGFTKGALRCLKQPARHADVVKIAVATRQRFAWLCYDIETDDAAIGCIFFPRSYFVESVLKDTAL